jgi:hypothetical protein
MVQDLKQDNMRLLKTAEVRDILDKWDENEISFSKMVDMLNEIAFIRATANKNNWSDMEKNIHEHLNKP